MFILCKVNPLRFVGVKFLTVFSNLQPLIFSANIGISNHIYILHSDVPPRAPKIRLFPPSATELKANSKSVAVCLITDFFPEVIKVEWKIGAKEQVAKVETDSVAKVETDSVTKMGTNTYSLISRLVVTKLQWESETISCHAKHEIDVAELSITRHSKYGTILRAAANVAEYLQIHLIPQLSQI